MATDQSDTKRPPQQGRTQDPADRLTQARSDANAADALVREVSAKRLAELQRASVSNAMRALDDPSLTPEDREQLKRHLAKASRQRKHRSRSIDIRCLQPRLGYRSVLAIVTLLLAGTAALTSWWNTPLGLVTVGTAVAVDWQVPGTTSRRHLLLPGTELTAVGRNDTERTLRVRRWLNGIGYAVSEIPYAAVR